MVAAGLGMALPVALGSWTDHLQLGLAAAVGSLLVGNAEAPDNPGARLRSEAVVVATAVATAVTAITIAGHGWWTAAALPLIAGMAAQAGGYSRALAVATGRFILFLIVTLTVSEETENRGGFLLLMTAGALWTAAVALTLDPVRRRLRPDVGGSRPPQTPASVPAQPTHAQKFARWKRMQGQIAGWEFTIRLGGCLALCLAVTEVLRQSWPGHHYSWVVLTVALLCRRELERLPVHVTQRALGAAAGVTATGFLVAQTPASWMLAIAVGALATLRPWLRNRNYLAYSACMTPLIVLILDAGKPIEGGLLLDRLVATMAGAAVVVAMNFTVAGLLAGSSRQKG